MPPPRWLHWDGFLLLGSAAIQENCTLRSASRGPARNPSRAILKEAAGPSGLLWRRRLGQPLPHADAWLPGLAQQRSPTFHPTPKCLRRIPLAAGGMPAFLTFVHIAGAANFPFITSACRGPSSNIGNFTSETSRRTHTQQSQATSPSRNQASGEQSRRSNVTKP